MTNLINTSAKKEKPRCESDCFYLLLNKKDNPVKFTINELIIGDTVKYKLENSHKFNKIIFMKLSMKDLKAERRNVYRLENSLLKERGTKWFILSKKEISKTTMKQHKIFEEITVPEILDFFNNKVTDVNKYRMYIVSF